MFTHKDYKTISIEMVGKVGILSICREEKLNALNGEVLEELQDFLNELIAKNEMFEMRGLILTGVGDKAFIAGADIASMSTMSVSEAQLFAEQGQVVTLLFEKLTIPVIACVNGFALGGGCEMALSCDFIFATENAVFAQPEVKLGLIPGFGGTQRLSKVVGRNRAKELIYSGRNFKVQEALEMGLILKVFETKDEMLKGAVSWVEKASANGPGAISIAKSVMNGGNDLTTENGLAMEAKHFSNIFTSEDMKEGTKAFLEKRAPQFSGK